MQCTLKISLSLHAQLYFYICFKILCQSSISYLSRILGHNQSEAADWKVEEKSLRGWYGPISIEWVAS